MVRVHTISGRAILALSVVALLAVVAGYFTPPQPDEGALAHIFQLSIAALAPVLLLFIATADWKRPLRAAQELRLSGAALVVAFLALYFLEHR